MAALPHSNSFRDVAIWVSLMTESFWRKTSGEVMVWRVNAGSPAAMTPLTMLRRGEGQQRFARGCRMCRYESVQESFGAYAVGEPVGVRLQRQDI